MSILFIGCSNTHHYAYPPNESKNLLNSTTKAEPKGFDGFGLSLPLSQGSSLHVDVEGIIGYIKETAFKDSLSQQQTIHDPWVCYTASF
jgi:hypothetical protein